MVEAYEEVEAASSGGPVEKKHTENYKWNERFRGAGVAEKQE